jgi:hypothetical protein
MSVHSRGGRGRAFFGILGAAACYAPSPARLTQMHPVDDARAARRLSCDTLTWTAASPLFAGKRPEKIADHPVMASDSSSLFIIGTNIKFFDGRPLPRQVLTVWSQDGTDIGQPPGDFVFAYPRGLVQGGVLHLLWAEPDSATRTTNLYDWPGRLTSIWAASYSPRAGWSVPRQVFAGTLRAAHRSLGATARTSTVEFGATVGSRGETSILTFTLADGNWTVRVIPAPGGLYPSVVQLGSKIVAAYVAGVADKGGDDDNSVFITRSTNDGRSWDPPRRLSRSGRHAAFDTQLLVDRIGQLHLIWRRGMGDTPDLFGQSPNVLGHMVSPDGGRAWTYPQELTLPSGAYDVRAGVDPCGRVHAFYAEPSSDGERRRLAHAVWQGAWLPPAYGPDSLDVGSLTVHQRTDGSLQVVGTALPKGAQDTVAATMFQFRLRRP